MYIKVSVAKVFTYFYRLHVYVSDSVQYGQKKFNKYLNVIIDL
jgi:hypothetical protein